MRQKWVNSPCSGDKNFNLRSVIATILLNELAFVVWDHRPCHDGDIVLEVLADNVLKVAEVQKIRLQIVEFAHFRCLITPGPNLEFSHERNHSSNESLVCFGESVIDEYCRVAGRCMYSNHYTRLKLVANLVLIMPNALSNLTKVTTYKFMGLQKLELLVHVLSFFG